ncbi:DivIVA domain-containing protein [Nocardioides sp.]|uniref:DivIVA domain-containing protein n=1 Tax=Nocardioides sp. TaxID=35761 RepID=UPI0039E59A8E
MMWVFAIVVVIVMGAVAAVAAGRGEPMAPAYDDRPDALVPADRPLVGDDLRRTRFSLAFRGYRMSEVDDLLARLATQLDEAGRDDEPGAELDAPDET